MWKRKISIKEQYGTLEHFLKGDEPCHYIGQRYIEGTNFYARREWRGVKDTAFAFYKWLCTWVKMAIFVMHDPIRIAKAFWKYRWLSAYLAAPMMVDKWIEGDRGEALRADLYALDCMISDSTDTLWKSLRADRRLGETKWSDVTVAFDYTLPKHIIFGFPGYYAINMQQHAAFMLPLMRKQLGCYYVDQAVACGIPGDMCTLPLVEVGVAVENEYPDIGNCWLTTNNPCDANMMDNTAMWRALSNDGKKAVHPFTTPLMYDDPTTKELGVHEVYSAIEFLEQQFGVPFNWDTFIEHIEDTNEFNRGSLNRWDIYAKSDNGALNSVVQGLFRIYFYQQGGTKYFKKANKKINKVFEKCVRKNIHPFPLARHRALAWSCGSTYYAHGVQWLYNCWGIMTVINMDSLTGHNIIQDPEAADRVFHSGADVTMVGLDVTHQCLLGSDATMRWRQAASQSHDPRTDARTFLADIVDFSIAANIQADARLFSTGMPLHDPLAAAVAADPSLVECFDLPMKVETETGDFHGTRGRTIGDPAGLIDPSAPRVHVALTVDHDRFITDFTWRIAQLAGD